MKSAYSSCFSLPAELISKQKEIRQTDKTVPCEVRFLILEKNPYTRSEY